MASSQHGTSTVGPPLLLRAKVALVGDAKVGKSALAQVLAAGRESGNTAFPKSYNMTVVSSAIYSVELSNFGKRLSIW